MTQTVSLVIHFTLTDQSVATEQQFQTPLNRLGQPSGWGTNHFLVSLSQSALREVFVSAINLLL